MIFPLPPDEMQRLESLRHYNVLDTPSEQSFDDLTLLAANICQTPMAMVSLVDESRQWFKSKIGIDATETARDIAFCAHTILNKDKVMEVCDAAADPRFKDSPLVTTKPNVRYYAGAPIVTPEGHALGALCVMDRLPRALTPDQLAALSALSRQVVSELELRRQAQALAKEAAERRRTEALLQQQFDLLSASKQSADRLLALAEKSRRALLSVLEDEKLAGQNLREAEERFRQLAENLAEVCWIATLDLSAVLYINPAYERIWGRSCKSLYDNPRSFQDGIHPDDRPRVVAGLEALNRGEAYDMEYRVVQPGGQIRWVHDRGAPIRNRAGAIYRTAGIAEDITQRKCTEAQLRQAQKMEAIGQLAGGVAHDFNNLLMIIGANLELLLMTDASLRPESREYLGDISNAADRAATLTRQLLAFSRSEATQKQPLDLNQLVENFSKLLKRILGEGIRVASEFAPALPVVEADPGMIEQVLMNLVVNARDAMPAGGKLTIRTELQAIDAAFVKANPRAREGRFACISVEDIGTGIAPENMSRIFEPFFTTKGAGKGTGLGLATVFGIAEQHKGWVDVSSQVGVGTTFRVFLPVSSAEVPRIGSSFREKPRGAGERILVAEDDGAVRVVVVEVLQRNGYVVFEADSAISARLVWIKEAEKIDLLLTDMVMSGGATGLELAEMLRMENPALKVILTSGYSSQLMSLEDATSRKISFLKKPFSPQLLAETVRQCLDAP